MLSRTSSFPRGPNFSLSTGSFYISPSPSGLVFPDSFYSFPPFDDSHSRFFFLRSLRLGRRLFPLLPPLFSDVRRFFPPRGIISIFFSIISSSLLAWGLPGLLSIDSFAASNTFARFLVFPFRCPRFPFSIVVYAPLRDPHPTPSLRPPLPIQTIVKSPVLPLFVTTVTP